MLRNLLCIMKWSNHFIVPFEDTIGDSFVFTWRTKRLLLMINRLVVWEMGRALHQALVVASNTCFVLGACESTLSSDVPCVSLMVLFAKSRIFLND